jgi:phospholipase/carboxylesterase
VTRTWFGLAAGVVALGCWWAIGPGAASADGRLSARPRASTTSTTPTIAIQPGEHRLGLNAGRDGTLYVPNRIASQPSVPLLVMLHGAGGSARSASLSFTFPLAEELGIAVLVPESRGTTWDAVGGGFGPDVAFIDRALRYTFQRVAVNPARLAIGGFSDGASYALSLGIPNGDLFTHLIAFSPGFITPAPPIGRPPIFLSHGTEDQVLPIDVTSRRIVPRLKSAGYTVTFREFDGPHAVPEPVAREAFEWLIR